MFEVGNIYDRRSEIHGLYRGQQYGGISTPADHPFVFLFTGEAGEQYGYRDGWDDNGVFLYTGEGQEGNMEFVRGNRAIRDHALEQLANRVAPCKDAEHGHLLERTQDQGGRGGRAGDT
jgi:hypothetical protein